MERRTDSWSYMLWHPAVYCLGDGEADMKGTDALSDMVMTLSDKCVTLPWVTHIHQGLTPVPTQLLVVPDIEVSVGLVSLV